MTKSNPTNADILREVRAMNSRLLALENWKIAEDAAKKAISDYKNEEQAHNDRSEKRKLIRDIGAFLSVLTILIWALIQYLGNHH